MPARLLDLTALVLDFLKHTYVLDRDHRLVGEGLSQLDLLFGERTYGRSAHRNHANGIAFAQKRNAEHRVQAAELGALLEFVFGIGLDVGNVYDPAFVGGAA